MPKNFIENYSAGEKPVNKIDLAAEIRWALSELDKIDALHSLDPDGWKKLSIIRKRLEAAVQERPSGQMEGYE